MSRFSLNVNPQIINDFGVPSSFARTATKTGLADSEYTREQKAKEESRENPNDPSKNPLTINGLISFLTANAPAAPNRFSVEFYKLSPSVSSPGEGPVGGVPGPQIPTTTLGSDPNSRYLSLQCESASFPGRAFETNIISRAYGPYRKTPTTALYNDITLTFRCSESHGEKEYFTQWLNEISPPNTNDYNFYSKYIRSVKIHQISRGGTADAASSFYTHTVALEEAFPIRIDEIPLDYNADNAVEKLNVTLAFYKWKTP